MPDNQLASGVHAIPGLVSVVIVNYNGEGLLQECLRSVHAQSYRQVEVIVVDNASTDKSVEMVRSEFPDDRLVVNTKNLGFARANNQGVSAARGEYIALLNNDATVEEGWLPPLIGMARMPGVGIVGSKVITDGVPARFYEMNGTINYLGYNIMRQFADLSTAFYVSGASLLFRRELVGRPFLDEYFLYHEDVYLSWRLRLSGYTVMMAQGSVVRHRGSSSTKRQSSKLITFYRERNRLVNCLLCYGMRTLLALLPYMVLDAIAKLALSLFSREKSFRGIVSGYLWIVGHAKWVRNERSHVQSHRRVSDAQVLRLMSCRLVDSDGAIARYVNGISKTYARLAGLEFYA